MNRRSRFFFAAMGLFATAALFTPTAQAACNRTCLAGQLTTYIDAMVAHNPSAVPVTTDLRFTEDSRDLKLGEGLWKTVTRKGAFRQDYLDTRKQIAAAHIVLYEGSTQILYTVVLRVSDRKISGIETLVYRVPADTDPKPDQLDHPLPVMNDPVPAAQKMPRDQMIKTALTYTEGLRRGAFFRANVPFAAEAYRIEDGTRTAGDGCRVSRNCDLNTQTGTLHPDVKASVAAVDEDSGIVLLWMNFGDTHNHGSGNALITFEAFKVWGGAIHAINAFFNFQPASTERAWPSAD